MIFLGFQTKTKVYYLSTHIFINFTYLEVTLGPHPYLLYQFRNYLMIGHIEQPQTFKIPFLNDKAVSIL